MQHLPDTASGAWPGEGGLQDFFVFGLLAVLCPRGDVCVCMCACFFTGHIIFRCLCGQFLGVPWGKEKVQNAVTPDGKYYALVNGADVSPLTLAFRLNQTSARKDEAHMEPSGLVTVPLQWHCLNSKRLGKMLSESYSA